VSGSTGKHIRRARDCGRPHPQQLCLCIACHEARKSAAKATLPKADTPDPAWMRSLMERTGYCQQEISILTGLSKTTVSRLANGRRPVTARIRSLIDESIPTLREQGR
jgi:hypothetical protein